MSIFSTAMAFTQLSKWLVLLNLAGATYPRCRSVHSRNEPL